MDVLDWWICLEYRSHLGAKLLLPEWESPASRRIKSLARRFGVTLPANLDGSGESPPPGAPLDTEPLVVSIGRSTFYFPPYWKTVPHWQKLFSAMQGKARAADYEELRNTWDSRKNETRPRLIARDPAIEAGRDCLNRALRDVDVCPSLDTMQMVKRAGGDVAIVRAPAVRGLLADPLLPSLRQEVRAAMVAAVVENCVRDAPEHKSESWQYPRPEVDLRADDKVLQEGFARWLVATRQRYEQVGVIAPARRAPLERWSRYRILAYIDLDLARRAVDLPLSDSAISQLMFPDSHHRGGKQDDPRQTWRTVRPQAMEVMTYAALVELGYEVQHHITVGLPRRQGPRSGAGEEPR
ncbi:MAG: DUF6387 family protein [Pseudomonadota bacterium]|nr:DUF6387 family protein [Pseudomonadota bacterium]